MTFREWWEEHERTQPHLNAPRRIRRELQRVAWEAREAEVERLQTAIRFVLACPDRMCPGCYFRLTGALAEQEG